jgi:ubiquinone/menaquinone biosynthesis C-methylase UbiE
MIQRERLESQDKKGKATMGSEQIQKRFWRPVYDRLAGLYDAVDWFTGNTTHRFRLRALPYLPPAGSRLLEIGFGSGRLHLELAPEYELAGLDRAFGMVRLTQRRLLARDVEARLCAGSVYALPWPNGHFDAVLSTFAFSAFPDAGAALDEMIRVTRPGGKVIIVDAGEATDGNAMAHLLANAWEAMGDYMRDEAALIEARGLSVEREEYGPWGCVHVVVGTLPDTHEE